MSKRGVAVIAVADLSGMEREDELGLVLERLGHARSGAHRYTFGM